MGRQRQPDEFRPTIRRGRLAEVTIYEVSAEELDVLARGAPDSIYLNFAIFLLSVSLSFIVALSTATIESTRLFTVFVVVAVIGGINGLVLLALWFRNRQSVSQLVGKIKQRVPPEAEETTPTSGLGS